MSYKKPHTIPVVLYACATATCFIEYIIIKHDGNIGFQILAARLLWLGFPFSYGAIIATTGAIYAVHSVANLIGFNPINQIAHNIESIALVLTMVLAGFYQWTVVVPRIFMKIRKLIKNKSNSTPRNI